MAVRGGGGARRSDESIRRSSTDLEHDERVDVRRGIPECQGRLGRLSLLGERVSLSEYGSGDLRRFCRRAASLGVL